MSAVFEKHNVTLHHGDCLEVMAALKESGVQVDSIVTDPPYHLTSIVKRFGAENAAPAQHGTDGAFARASRGFMGKMWDGGDIAFRRETWELALALLKPGGHLIAFSGTRTYHRMAVAIEDAGFEIRDQIGWLYGSGFPKSHDVSKAIDKVCGATREKVAPRSVISHQRNIGNRRPYMDNPNHKTDSDTPASAAAAAWQGWGTALKPAQEIMALGQKPFPFMDDLNKIGSAISVLELKLWSMFPVNAAQEFLGLNPRELDGASNSVQWSAGERSNTLDALSGLMDTSQFVSAMILSSNTVSLWKSTLAALCHPENTSTTETELSQIIDLRTLKSLVSKITPESIILGQMQQSGARADACSATRIFNAVIMKLRGILELSAAENAILQEAVNCREGTVKPNLNEIVLARKPLIGTVAQNVLEHGTGALNIDGCRIAADDEIIETSGRKTNSNCHNGYKRPGASMFNTGKDAERNGPANNLGRWPANIVHDGSDEVLAAFPQSKFGGNVTGNEPSAGTKEIYGDFSGRKPFEGHADNGSAARFFYSAKAQDDDRCGSKHPTIKPIDLMAYLCRLVTPPGGHVLDIFAGSGTTGMAAMREGFKATLIECEAEYVEDIKRRLLHVSGENTPLFGGGL